jgi:hypothetical protein
MTSDSWVDWIVAILLVTVASVLWDMWRTCMLRSCDWQHRCDVPNDAGDYFGIYQCSHCKNVSTGAPRWPRSVE